MRAEVFCVNDGRISLKGECIIGFRTLNCNSVLCVVESRPYDTVYRLKMKHNDIIDMYGAIKRHYFIQVRRVVS